MRTEQTFNEHFQTWYNTIHKKTCISTIFSRYALKHTQKTQWERQKKHTAKCLNFKKCPLMATRGYPLDALMEKSTSLWHYPASSGYTTPSRFLSLWYTQIYKISDFLNRLKQLCTIIKCSKIFFFFFIWEISSNHLVSWEPDVITTTGLLRPFQVIPTHPLPPSLPSHWLTSPLYAQDMAISWVN